MRNQVLQALEILEAFATSVDIWETFPSLFFSMTGPAKLILKLRDHETLKSIIGHHGWPTKTIFEF